MNLPVHSFLLDGLHRVIPSRYSEPDSALAEIAGSAGMLKDLIGLSAATDDRIQGEQQGLMGISTYELVYGIPHAHIVNAAFTHTSDAGSRFNDHTRGAWYAADELETSLAEVIYHKARRLGEMVVPGLPGNRPNKETCRYHDWLADFRSIFHVLEPEAAFAECLLPDPVPECYSASQKLARELVGAKSNGLVYSSVRRHGSRCLVCFRPALVYNPRQAVEAIEITFTAVPGEYYRADWSTVV